MKFDLAAMTRRARNPRRKTIALKPITAPSTHATNLYQTCYAPIIALWLAALPAIMAEYERTLGEMTTDAPSDVSVRIEAATSEANGVLVRVAVMLERWASIVESWQRRRWVANVLTATTVDLKTMIGAPDMRMTVEAAVARNTGLIRSVSDEARRRVGDTVFRGLQKRSPAAEVARELREAVALERKRALRIASDQTVKLTSALNEERRRQAGIMAWEWVSSHKVHPRPEHAARDGRLYSDEPSDRGREYQGQSVAPAPDDMPGELPFCGCTSRAVLML